MTVDEMRGTTFQQSPLAWRGYSEQEVDEFVSRAAHTVEEVQRENTAQRAEIDRLRNFYRRHGTDVDHSVDRPDEWSTPAMPNRLISEVQRYVQTQVSQADAYAEMVTTHHEPQAQEMLLHAQLRSKIVIEDTIRTFLHRADDRQRIHFELEQLAQWVGALAEALWAQTTAMSQTVTAQLDRQPELESLRPE
jgi:DivIVA domain-containing protein